MAVAVATLAGATTASHAGEVGPLVTGVSSSVSDGAYSFGQPIPITVTFDVPVTVSGTPQLTLETGFTDRVINYAVGSGTTTLTFTYTVQIGDWSLDLDYFDRLSLSLNGGAIVDSSTADPADLLLPVPGTPGSLGFNKNIVIDDGNIPTVTNVTSTAPDGTYGLGAVIPVHVSFSEGVNVTGTPQLTLETGAVDQVVDYSGGSGTSTLTFTYTVQTGDTTSDLDYLDANALALNGGAVQDGVANNAILTLPTPGTAGSLSANKNIAIDFDVVSVTNVSSSAADNAYSTGASIQITVDFSASVTVTGTPQLALETGATDRLANYASGSGSSTLVFSYVVQAGDDSADLDATGTSALSLNGGTIEDGAANDASLLLPAPGTSGSLGANKAIVIDTEAPETAVDSGPADPTSNADATLTFSGTDNHTANDALSFECSLDGAGFAACVSPQSYVALAEGSHTFEVRASDAPGNVDPSPATHIWVIDATPPETVLDSTPADPTNSSSADFTFHGVDGGSGVAAVHCSLDGGPFVPCDTLTTQSYAGLAEGPHVFAVRATDNLALVDPTPASFIWTIDTTAPTVTVEQAAGQSDPAGPGAVHFTVTFSESVGTSFDGNDVTLGGTALPTTAVVSGGPIVFDVAVSGMTVTGTVTAALAAGVATDLAGNGNTASTSLDNTVTVDLTGVFTTEVPTLSEWALLLLALGLAGAGVLRLRP